MKSLENTYLEFTMEGYCWLIPLSCVKEIRENGMWDQNLPVLCWEELLGQPLMNRKRKYGIVLDMGNGLGIEADEVSGVCEIAPEHLLELKKPVRNKKNRFISAAADMGDERGMAYILSTTVLAEELDIILE